MTKRTQIPDEASHPTMAEGRIYLGEETKIDPKDERRQRESFRKRKKTIFKNANAISKRCKAEVYVVLLRKGKWFTFTSTEKLGWPPTAESMANIYPLPNTTTSANYEPTKSVEMESDIVDSSVNTPEEEMQQMERELSSGLLAMSKEKEKRTFVIPRAPKLNFDINITHDIDREEVERRRSVSKGLQGNNWDINQDASACVRAATEDHEGF